MPRSLPAARMTSRGYGGRLDRSGPRRVPLPLLVGVGGPTSLRHNSGTRPPVPSLQSRHVAAVVHHEVYALDGGGVERLNVCTMYSDASTPNTADVVFRQNIPLEPYPSVTTTAEHVLRAVAVPAWVMSWRSMPSEVRRACRSVTLIGDACALLQDLRYTARTGELGLIGQIALLDALHVPQEMVAEVEQRMVRIATASLSLSCLQATWIAFYEPYLRVEAERGTHASPEAIRRLLERDPKDIPVLEMTASFATGVMLTGDKALIDLGFAPASGVSLK
jgi:hypothetical protein